MLPSESVKQLFPMKVRNRGRIYYEDFQCELVDLTGKTAEFEVFGSGEEPYVVTIGINPKGVDAFDCSCPYFRGSGYCKHIWGSLLELDSIVEDGQTPAEALTEHATRREEREGYPSIDGKWKDSGNFRTAGNRTAGKKYGSPGSGGKGGLPKPKPPKWTTQLIPLASSQRTRSTLIDQVAATQSREYSYLLDLQASAETSSIAIELQMRERKTSGDFGKWKSRSVSTLPSSGTAYPEHSMSLDDLTRELVQANDVDSYYGSYSRYSYVAPAINRVTLKHSRGVAVLRRLCESGQFFWSLSKDLPEQNRQPIAWDDGVAWEFRILIESRAEEKTWTVTGELYRPGTQERLALDLPMIVMPGVALLYDNRLSRFGSERFRDWIFSLRKNSSLSIPFADRDRFLKVLVESGALVNDRHVRLPSDLRIARQESGPIPKLVARKWNDLRRTPVFLGEIRFDYAGTEIACDDPRESFGTGEPNVVVNRDLKAESEFLRGLFDIRGIQRHQEEYGYGSWKQSMPQGKHHIQFSEGRLPQVAGELNERGWVCELEGKSVRKSGAFNLEITSGIDWFDLEVSADFGGVSAELPALLEAVRSGARLVKLTDGSLGTLPEEWSEQLRKLAGLAEVEQGKLRYSQVQALMLDSLLASRKDAVRTDRKFETLRKKLRSFEGIKPVESPKSFQGALRDYQKLGLGWLRFLQEFGFGGCLADDMGLGKTIQVLAFLELRRKRKIDADKPRKPSLIVVPKSLIFNWIDEAARFCPKLRVAAYHGKDRQSALDHLDEIDVLLTTYGTLRLDIEQLGKLRFDYAILDEAQAVKNLQSLANKAVRVIQSDHRLALTGTPIENQVGELWALFEFLNPGLLGGSGNFKELTKSLQEDDSNLAMLSTGIRPFILRRTKEQVLTELPEKTEQTLYCELSPKERKHYDELKEFYRQKLLGHVREKGLAKSQIHILEALLRLRQAACHPGLVRKSLAGDMSSKLEVLLEQLQEILAEGHKVLVFSQFTTLLGIVKQELDKLKIRYEYLDGKTTKRKESVERFQSDEGCPVFLLSLKAGGTGLNLTAADYVFILDPWWNPAVEKQAVDRAHRMGQTNRVFAYRLIARDTVEEKILTLQERKKELADRIITADASLMQTLTVEDLELLLS